jgi:hypothetical protein
MAPRRRATSADAALLEYLVADSRSFCLSSRLMKCARWISVWIGAHCSPGGRVVALAQARRGAPDAGLAALERLYSLLISRRSRRACSRKRAAPIVPHGELHYLPYAALQNLVRGAAT